MKAFHGSGRRTNERNPRPDYWFNDDGNPTFRQNSEFFADYFSHAVLSPNEPFAVEALDNLREWFPGQMEYMEMIIAEATGAGG